MSNGTVFGEPSPYDTDGAPLITCPYCGFQDEDSWELACGDECEDIECDCGLCEKPFLASRHISVTYSTKKSADAGGRS